MSDVTTFKIKKMTKMQKVFDRYAARKGFQVSSLRLLLYGKKILPDETPESLKLRDQDQIDCTLEQTGGGKAPAAAYKKGALSNYSRAGLKRSAHCRLEHQKMKMNKQGKI
jgi:hypothetical protein